MVLADRDYDVAACRGTRRPRLVLSAVAPRGKRGRLRFLPDPVRSVDDSRQLVIVAGRCAAFRELYYFLFHTPARRISPIVPWPSLCITLSVLPSSAAIRLTAERAGIKRLRVYLPES